MFLALCFSLQLAECESYRFDPELHAVPGAFAAPVPVDLEVTSSESSVVLDAAPPPRPYHGSARPEAVTSKQWQSIGVGKRNRLLAWIAVPDNANQYEAFVKGKIEFSTLMRKTDSKVLPVLASVPELASCSACASPCCVAAVADVYVVEFACSDTSQISAVCPKFGATVVD